MDFGRLLVYCGGSSGTDQPAANGCHSASIADSGGCQLLRRSLVGGIIAALVIFHRFNMIAYHSAAAGPGCVKHDTAGYSLADHLHGLAVEPQMGDTLSPYYTQKPDKYRINDMMKAGRIYGPGNAAVETVAVPSVKPNDVLIEVKAAGICGTDLHILAGEYEAVYPLIPGHEFSGVVQAVGQNVHHFKPGDRVTADPNIPCHYCIPCQRNEPNQCENLAAVGVTRDGGFAEYVAVAQSNVFAIGDLSYQAAALVEPLACVVWGLKRVQVQPGDNVLVLGAGPMGALLMQAVRQAGAARVIVVDIVPHRLEMAKSLGATEVILSDEHLSQRLHTLAPHGFDIVAEVTGIPRILEQAFDYVRPRGKVWVFGVCPPDQQASFNPYQVFRKDLTIIGSFAVNRTFHESIALIQSGAVQVDPLVSHVLPLDDFVKALEIAAHDPNRMKVQLQMGDN